MNSHVVCVLEQLAVGAVPLRPRPGTHAGILVMIAWQLSSFADPVPALHSTGMSLAISRRGAHGGPTRAVALVG